MNEEGCIIYLEEELLWWGEMRVLRVLLASFRLRSFQS